MKVQIELKALLHRTNKNWHEGKHSLQPWWEYFLGVLRHAYRLFQKRVGLIAEARGSKTALILDILQHFQGADGKIDGDIYEQKLKKRQQEIISLMANHVDADKAA